MICFGIIRIIENNYLIKVEGDSKSVFYREVFFKFDASARPRVLGRFSTQMKEDLILAKEEGKTDLVKFRATSPKVTGILPTKASPNGGVYLTIYGENLESQNIDLGGTGDKENTGEGEDYFIYLERENDRVVCGIDRMLTLHGRPLGGKDFR